MTLTSAFDSFFFGNFNLANNFWTARARSLIFHMSILCDKTLSRIPKCSPYALTLKFDLRFKNFIFNFVNNTWIVSARALIFHMSIHSYRSVVWKPTVLTLWPWPWSLAYFINLIYNIWIVSARDLIIRMSNLCDKIFLLVLNLLTLTFVH